ncbi:MAG: neutral/alkaline non-lysosomal ceramidase N-terminal domain-containing protein, partial [Alphaproteobacteria bacterium]
MTHFMAGVGRADMTPPVGIAHVNWGARTHDRAEGIDLPLLATILLLEQGGVRAAIVDLDFLLMSSEESRELRVVVGEELGLAPEHVRLSFTHTHSGPPWATQGFGTQAQLPGMELVPAYRAKVLDALREAARAARAALRPARSASGYGRSEVTVNRRLALPDGRVVVSQNWDGYRDPVLSVLRIDALDGRSIATIVGYGTHPIVLAHGNRLVSPDYPGHLKRVVEQAMGGHCLFLQGCAGDQIPREALVADRDARGVEADLRAHAPRRVAVGDQRLARDLVARAAL